MQKEPAFWSGLDFEGANDKHLNLGVFLELCRRSAGQLQVLDTSVLTFHNNDKDWCLLKLLAQMGLTSRLRTLITGHHYCMDIDVPGSICKLLAACPSLTCASVALNGCWSSYPAFLRTPPIGGSTSVRMKLGGDGSGGAGRTDFAAFASALAEALSACPVEQLILSPIYEHDLNPELFEGIVIGDLFDDVDPATAATAAAEEATAALATALAHPATGPREIVNESDDLGNSPLFARMWRALSPLSYLSRVNIQSDFDGPGEEELAAALGPSRSQIKILQIGNTLEDGR